MLLEIALALLGTVPRSVIYSHEVLPTGVGITSSRTGAIEDSPWYLRLLLAQMPSPDLFLVPQLDFLLPLDPEKRTADQALLVARKFRQVSDGALVRLAADLADARDAFRDSARRRNYEDGRLLGDEFVKFVVLLQYLFEVPRDNYNLNPWSFEGGVPDYQWQRVAPPRMNARNFIDPILECDWVRTNCRRRYDSGADFAAL